MSKQMEMASPPCASRVQLPRENIYGHYDRLLWVRDRLVPSDHALELGCGTGYMLTLPLRFWGYDVTGIDLDEQSILAGRAIMEEAGIAGDALQLVDLADYSLELTVVIASEVLEHLSDDVLDSVLSTIHAKLPPHGRLLVTVPNGYSWFELESALWWRLRLGRVLEALHVPGAVERVKWMLIGQYRDSARPSTLADSPHLQRFTLHGIHRRLEQAGFDVVETRGSVLLCGPFSNLFLTGFRRAMAANLAIGRRVPRLASGFRLVAVPRDR